MKAIVRLIALLLVFSTTASLYSQTEKVYVVLFMHNEDGTFGDIDDPDVRNAYLRHREGLIQMAQYLHENNVSFAWQSDWKFLELALMYENEDLISETNGKNIVRWMKEDMGIAVDAHSHEHYGYNYADVACLLDSLGIEPTRIIGGHIWDPYISTYADWERFREPLRGTKFPHFFWQPDVLMGSGTPNHTYDPAPSGIWRPKDKYHFWEDDPEGEILCVGQYTGDLAGVEELVKIRKSGSVSSTDILTCSIHTPQSFPADFMDDFSQNLIEPLLAMQEQGDVEIVDFTELIEIWETEYGQKTHLYNPLTDYVPEQFDLWIPGESAGQKGLFVRVSLPDECRFPNDTAPVVVHATGGWDGLGVTKKTHGLHDQGFIEIDFNFPGSGLPGSLSGGSYDHRGENCIMALRDVARFAQGIIPDINGYYLRDMLGDIIPDPENTGLCGWSNGGNATITAAGAYGEDLPGLAWIVNWESPVGDGMPNVDAGGHGKSNTAYNPMTGEFDETKLAYSSVLEITEGFSGGFYFDLNENGTLNPAIDYIAGYQFYNGKCFYSEWLREAAENLGITYPDHIASVEETADFWLYRNGEYWINAAVTHNPNLMFLVEAGDHDHVQEAPDHPHVLNQYMGFLRAGVRFVRLNPDRYYVNQVVGFEIEGVVDNDGLISYNHLSIRNALQPRNIPLLSGEKSTVAAVCELADRTRDNKVEPQINGATGMDLDLAIEQADALHVYPNPTSGSTVIGFVMTAKDEISLIVYSSTGERINTIFQGVLSPGEQQVTWNGLNSQGQALSPGLYYIALISSTQKIVRSIILIR